MKDEVNNEEMPEEMAKGGGLFCRYEWLNAA
jgi:hypothetical protein